MRLTVRLAGYVWRPLTDSDEDTDFIVNMRNRPEAQAVFYTKTITREDHHRFFKLTEERDEINWIIEKDGKRVGACGIFRFDWKNRRAESGRLVMALPELYLLSFVVMHEVVFEHLKLNKSCGETLTTNTVINRALDRVGVVREGVLREHVHIDGVLRDVCIYGTLASDWKKSRPGIIAQCGEPQVIRHTEEDVG